MFVVENNRYKQAFGLVGNEIEKGYKGDIKIILPNGLSSNNGNDYINHFNNVANREFCVDLKNWNFSVVNGVLEVHFTVVEMPELTGFVLH